MPTARALRTITFTAPLPYRGLSPNDRAHWARKAKAVAEYRRDVRLCLLAAIGVGNVPRFEQASISLEFVTKTAARHDGDNLQAAWKAGQDALVDAGLLPDDSSEHLRIQGVTWRKAARGEALGVRVTATEVQAMTTTITTARPLMPVDGTARAGAEAVARLIVLQQGEKRGVWWMEMGAQRG